MKKGIVILMLATLVGSLGYLAVRRFSSSRPGPSAALPERFPILPRLELPRDYGYFIGDAIPLTLVIETTDGVVLNLVNLPQKGDRHGPFEIRDLRITSSSPTQEQTIYRAAYTLQYFGPTPVTARFEALEILYALPDDTAAVSHTYTYKRLLTQPVTVHIARIGPFRPTPALDIAGPLADRRTGLVWTAFAVGATLLLAAGGGWGREWWRNRQRYRTPAPLPPTAAAEALQRLQQEEVAFRPPVTPAPAAGTRLGCIVRQYLHAEHGLPASALTTPELAARLNGLPLFRELLGVLERCDALTYQPSSASPDEERQLWWETMMLFEKLQKVNAP